MKALEDWRKDELVQRLIESEATLKALLDGEVDAVIDPRSKEPVLLGKALEALRASEEQYRRIVETANEGIWTIDARSEITFVNWPLAAMLGYSTDEIVGRSLFDFLPSTPGARSAHTRRLERSRQGISEASEVEFLRRDGSELWALLKTSPIRDSEGSFVGTLAMMTDRTQDRRVVEALRKSEEQYRQIVEATSDGIIKLDERARIVFANRRFAEMIGQQAHELLDHSVLDYMSVSARAFAVEAMTGRRDGLVESIDSTFRHKDGSDIAVNIAGAILFDSQGRFDGHLGVVRDITERNKLQSQLMVSDRMASMGTLAAGVAHEINNPLAAVVANLEYIAERLARPAEGENALLMNELKGPLDDARDAAERVRFIVRDLKVFSRTPGDEPSLSVGVESVMESSLRMAWNEIRHRAQLVKSYGVVPAVLVNEARLGQVFINLLVNAAQALPEGRMEDNQIRVSTRLDGERVVVEVADNGAGIAPEILGRIFDAFFTTKAVGVGTGLGLAICQRIVTDMGGELTVTSEVGKGTTFRVALPVAAVMVGEVTPSAAPAPLAVRRGRILVIDDDELVLRSVMRILSREHDVVALTSGKEALARCADGEPFDVILCDLMMPGMTGIDLLRELRRTLPATAERVVFLTGGAFSPAAQQFLAETSVEQVEKPFHPASLRALVQRHLRMFGRVTT